MSSDARRRFTACANAADERRQLRKRQQQERLLNNPVVQIHPEEETLKQGWRYWLLEANVSKLFQF